MAQYTSTYPLSQRDQYYPNENVDFVLNFANKTILPNSLLVTGRLVVYSGGNPAQPVYVENGDEVYYDGHVGAHGVFQTWTSSMSDRVIETFNHYPRYIKMRTTAMFTSEDLSCMSTEAPQLKCFDQQQPETAGEDTTCLTSTSVLVLPNNTTGGRAFAIKPEVCLNTAPAIPYSVSGEVKLSVQLSSQTQFLYGADAGDYSFYLTDLELCYNTVPDNKKVTAIPYVYKQSLKQIISSNNQALNFNTPIPTNSLFSSFILTASENDVTMDYLTMDPLEGLNRVDWSINDMNQGILEYPLEHNEEIKLNYLMAVLNSNSMDVKQSIEPQALSAVNKIRGVGLNYLQALANTKVSMNILSDASNQTQYACYIYFLGQSGFSAM